MIECFVESPTSGRGKLVHLPLEIMPHCAEGIVEPPLADFSSWDDEELFLAGIARDHRVWGSLPRCMRGDPKFASKAIGANAKVVTLFNGELFRKKSIIRWILSCNHLVWPLMDRRITGSANNMIVGIRCNHRVWEVLPEENRSSEDFALKAVRSNHLVWEVLPNSFKESREFVAASIMGNHRVWDLLPKHVQDDMRSNPLVGNILSLLYGEEKEEEEEVQTRPKASGVKEWQTDGRRKLASALAQRARGAPMKHRPQKGVSWLPHREHREPTPRRQQQEGVSWLPHREHREPTPRRGWDGKWKEESF